MLGLFDKMNPLEGDLTQSFNDSLVPRCVFSQLFKFEKGIIL